MKAPKLPSFIRSTANKQFQFQTRYYNARKERVQEARDQASSSTKDGIKKGHFRSAWEKKPSSKDPSSTLRVFIIIVMLSTVAYWIIKF